MGYFTLLGGLLPESLPNNNKAIYEHLTSKDCVFRNSLDRNYHEECAKQKGMTAEQIKEKCEKDCFVLFTYWMEHEFSPILDTDEVFEWLDKKFPNESREFRADRIFAFLRHYWRFFSVCPYSCPKEYRGMAKAFANYIKGEVTDEELYLLISHKQAKSKNNVEWTGKDTNLARFADKYDISDLDIRTFFNRSHFYKAQSLSKNKMPDGVKPHDKTFVDILSRYPKP